MTLISGGEEMVDDELLEKVRISLEAGATGLVFGEIFGNALSRRL
jgi:DhnA family fructose-bisphosphate aldolase class Ia